MSDSTKPNLILDLDETLLYSISKDELLGLKKDTKAKLSKDYTTYKMDGGYYTVVERPGLQKFLDYAFENFNVSIWTAASKDYAIFIIDNIIIGKNSDRIIDWIFCSYHCELSKKKMKSIKNLDMLWDNYNLDGYSKDNTIIMDDHPIVYKTQTENCIFMDPFQITAANIDERDDFLDRVIPELENMKENFNKGEPMNTEQANKNLSDPFKVADEVEAESKRKIKMEVEEKFVKKQQEKKNSGYAPAPAPAPPAPAAPAPAPAPAPPAPAPAEKKRLEDAAEAKAKRLAAEKKRLEDEEQLAAEKKRLEDAAEAKAKRLAAEKKRLEDEEQLAAIEKAEQAAETAKAKRLAAEKKRLEDEAKRDVE